MKKAGIIATMIIVATVTIGTGIYTYNQSQQKAIAKPTNIVEEVQKPKKIDQNSIIPNNNIIYSAQKYAVPANEVQKMLQGKVSDHNKQVFLTFDDGPSKNTPKVLDILKEEGVHATFFVLGSSLDESAQNKDYLKREIYEGNAIANHSYSHNFKKLYPHNKLDITTFMNEVEQTNQIMKSVLGPEFDTRVLRMPGGYMSRQYYKDPSLHEFDAILNNKKIVSIDWDGENGDATGRRYSPEQLVHNAIESTKDDTHIVLLMHDSATKKSTVDALKQLIQFYKSNGYEFKVISNPVE